MNESSVGSFTRWMIDSSPESFVCQKTLSSLLMESISLLKERDAMVLHLRIVDDMTFRDIGEEIGVGAERARQIFLRIIRFIRRRVANNEKIKELFLGVEAVEDEKARTLREIEGWRENQRKQEELRKELIAIERVRTGEKLGLSPEQIKMFADEIDRGEVRVMKIARQTSDPDGSANDLIRIFEIVSTYRETILERELERFLIKPWRSF